MSILWKGKLITETKTPTHKQKKIKKLTELGYEAFLKFEQRRVEKFRDHDRPVPSILSWVQSK